MSDAKTVAALQRNLADAEVERLRLVEALAASHIAAQRRKTAVLAFARNKMHAPWLKELAALLAEDTGVDVNGDAT